jgi:HK97 family phage major capsid protein
MTPEEYDALTIDAQIAYQRDIMSGVIDAAKADQTRSESGHALTEDEAATFDAADVACRSLETRQAADNKQAERELRIAELHRKLGTGAPTKVTAEPGEYTERDDSPSFFVDLWQAKQGNTESMDRLRRNNQFRAAYPADGSTRALNTTAGAGGEFIPPLWLENDLIKLARPGRPVADIMPKHNLPAGTNSISIPKINTGTQVAIQGTQNTPVQQTDLTTGSVNMQVLTIAGGQTISMQDIEQSPINVDQIVLADLAADYGRAIDNFVLNQAGVGISNLAIPAGNQIAFTGALTGAAAVAALYSKVAGAIQTIQTSRYANPSHIVMHPRRWAWLTAQVDSNNRPLIVPTAVAYNPVAQQDNLAPMGVVGMWQGLPVLIDPQVATNGGAGTNQDAIYIVRADDMWLMEGQVRAQAFEQTYANQLSLFLRLYNYVAFTGQRFLASTAIISGTNLTTPTF